MSNYPSYPSTFIDEETLITAFKNQLLVHQPFTKLLVLSHEDEYVDSDVLFSLSAEAHVTNTIDAFTHCQKRLRHEKPEVSRAMRSFRKRVLECEVVTKAFGTVYAGMQQRYLAGDIHGLRAVVFAAQPTAKKRRLAGPSPHSSPAASPKRGDQTGEVSLEYESDDATIIILENVSSKGESDENVSGGSESFQSVKRVKSVKSVSAESASDNENELEASGDEIAVSEDADAKLLKQEREKVLSLEILHKRFKNIKNFASAKDLWFERYNLSDWVRQAQSHVLRQCEQGLALDSKESHIADILMLNNIVVFSKRYHPSFLKAAQPLVKTHWERATAAFAEQRIDMRLPQSIADCIFPLFNDLGAGRGFEATLKKHMKTALDFENPVIDEMAPFDVLLVIRSFYKAIRKRERMQAFGSTRKCTGEVTEVHAVLHTLPEEVFDHPALVVRWANGQSDSSQKHRSTYLKKPLGQKADGRVLSNKFEHAFLEAKSCVHADTAKQTIYDLFKLAQFCQGSINFKARNNISDPPCCALHFLRETLEIYHMALHHDGVYTARGQKSETLQNFSQEENALLGGCGGSPTFVHWLSIVNVSSAAVQVGWKICVSWLLLLAHCCM
ncbi:hypothetical protein BDZ88DRAFT_484954 [Geranomyces variabilis]|nr:hypothetical protein BDZ88DRAFT_484954 [Geranomyces variabilis]